MEEINHVLFVHETVVTRNRHNWEEFIEGNILKNLSIVIKNIGIVH